MNNRDRVRKALADLNSHHHHHQAQTDSILFLDGFSYEDRSGAFKELCMHLQKVNGVDKLLDCSQWALELDTTVMVVVATTDKAGSCINCCCMVSPAGRIRVAASKRGAVLHTYTVTRVNEKWLKSIEGHARVLC